MKRLPTVALLIFALLTLLILPAMQQDPPTHQDEALQNALAARAAAAKQVLDYAVSVEESGRDAFEHDSALERRLKWSRRAAVAAAEAGAMTLREALSQHVAKAERLLALEEELYKAGRRLLIDLHMGRYEVADAKVQLARAGK